MLSGLWVPTLTGHNKDCQWFLIACLFDAQYSGLVLGGFDHQMIPRSRPPPSGEGSDETNVTRFGSVTFSGTLLGVVLLVSTAVRTEGGQNRVTACYSYCFLKTRSRLLRILFLCMQTNNLANLICSPACCFLFEMPPKPGSTHLKRSRSSAAA